jgi:hypothetical protein
MNREFNDELLSAYLDGQLAANEAAVVEAHLAADEQARQMLAELRSLSEQVRDLPRQSANPQFADRVMQAALAARPAAKPDPSDKVRRGSRLPVVLAGVAAIAAAVLLAIWMGGGSGAWSVPGSNTNITTVPVPETNPGSGDPAAPAAVSAAEAALAQLRQAIPQEGEVVVVRVRLAAGAPAAQAIDAALTAAGIAHRAASDLTTAAAPAGAAYRHQLADKFGGQEPGVPNTALHEGTIAAADAVFVESTWELLEKAVGALAAAPEQTVQLQPLTKVAAIATAVGNVVEGEGEVTPKGVAPPPLANFAQRLPASIFRMEKTAGEPVAVPPAAAPIDGQRKVRVLLLVETVKPAQ